MFTIPKTTLIIKPSPSEITKILSYSQGIEQGKYEETEHNILKELESVQSFLYRHFKDTSYYKQMLPSLNQPARFFASSKTHKFDNLSDINVTNLKL